MTKESVSWMSLEHSLAQALLGFLSQVPTPLLASSAPLSFPLSKQPLCTLHLMVDRPYAPPGDSFLLSLMDLKTHSGALSDMRVFNPSSQA